jgi:hypothetical protein
MLKPTALKDWLVFRTRTAYRLVLKVFPKPQTPPKPEQDLTFVSMCGGKHLGLLQECLLSLYDAWSILPKLHIVSDGSVTISELQQALRWWPGTKTFSLWEESVAYHNERGRQSIVEFAQSNIMGKKLAIILKAGEQGPTLWCDSDILWFKEFSSIPKHDETSNLPVLKISEDYQPSYDPRLIEYGLRHLDCPPYRNAGLLYIQGELLKHCNLQPLLDLAAEQPCNDAEQTTFAEANYQLNSGIWLRDEIACFSDDREVNLPRYGGKNWVARHYVGPVRHLFWRDALLLRLGLKDRLFKASARSELLDEVRDTSGKDY